MTAVQTQPDAGTCDTVITGISRAWNEGDAIGFASYFAEDADMVNAHGMHVRGRQAIAGLYDMLFRSVFKDASLEFEVGSRRQLRKAEMVHLRLEINIGRGHLAGEHHTITSMLLEQKPNGWAISSLHSTLVDAA